MKKMNFEESLKRLEEITERLESGELSLDESLKFFEEGVKLSRFCEQKLTETEQKVKILESTDTEDFDSALEEVECTEEPAEHSKPAKKKKKNEDDEPQPDEAGEGMENFLF